MRITVNRIYDDGDSTIGTLLVDGEFFCFTLEDEFRAKKLKGETRIAEGTYKLLIRREDTPLTLKHRKSYGSWFKYHIEIGGVKDFTGIYIHAGNDQTHTDGCLLLGDVLANTKIQKKNPLASSVQAVKRFYELVYPVLDRGEEVLIDIHQVY